MMKLKFNLNLLLMSLLAIFVVTACDSDDERPYEPETVVQVTFKNMFPDATQVQWEPKLGYSVAEFYDGGEEKKAWFNTDGEWLLTETDLAYADLPDAVVNAIAGSKYAGWKKDDVSYLERKDMESVYVVEVEQGEQELDLYYSPEGALLKVVTDGSNDHNAVPTPVNENILKVVNELYPSAKILEIDVEQNRIEVDLVQEDRLPFTMILDKDYNWVQSEWDAAWSRVPQTVKDAVTEAGYTVNENEDEATMIIRPASTGEEIIYRIELDREPDDIILYFTDSGEPVSD